MKFSTLAAAATLLAAAAFPAAAQAASATSSVNVRTGPGTNFSVVDTLRPGEQVDVGRCTSGWCYVTHSGPDGWVSSNYLSNDDGYEAPSSGSNKPDVSIGFSVPGFSFQFGNGGFDVRPDRPNYNGQVCFYDRPNFRGARFCAEPGDRIARLGSWNDRISSINVSGGAEALVCENVNFGGRCIVVSRDVRDLRAADDRISSIRVR